jgi:hypothetical protein
MLLYQVQEVKCYEFGEIMCGTVSIPNSMKKLTATKELLNAYRLIMDNEIK